MNALGIKFFAILAACLCLVGIWFLVIQERTFMAYQAALQQALDEPFAAAAGADLATFAAAHPAVDTYRLDAKGAVVSFTAPSERVLRRSIDLGPVEAFVRRAHSYPIFGDDPQSLTGQRVFSAAPVDPKQPDAGFIYVVSRAARLDGVASGMWDNLVFDEGIMLAGLGLSAALIASFMLTLRITRRLRMLVRAMDEFQATDFKTPVRVEEGAGQSGDELDRVGYAFNATVAHIRGQVERLEQTEAVRRDLIASVSHDLRTPLASLRGYLETLMLKDRVLTQEEKRAYLEIAARQSERLNTLVTELFDLVKLEGGDAQLDLEPFQISELVQDVVQKFQLAAQKKQLVVEGKIAPEAPFVTGDIGLIERVFENLLQNAIRHTPPGGRIVLTVAPGTKYVAVDVTDTGSGIPEDDLPNIFDRFYRVDKSRNSDSGGSGLGLAIVKRIVEMHGGRIDAASRMGVGTSFTITLPFAGSAAA